MSHSVWRVYIRQVRRYHTVATCHSEASRCECAGRRLRGAAGGGAAGGAAAAAPAAPPPSKGAPSLRSEGSASQSRSAPPGTSGFLW